MSNHLSESTLAAMMLINDSYPVPDTAETSLCETALHLSVKTTITSLVDKKTPILDTENIDGGNLIIRAFPLSLLTRPSPEVVDSSSRRNESSVVDIILDAEEAQAPPEYSAEAVSSSSRDQKMAPTPLEPSDMMGLSLSTESATKAASVTPVSSNLSTILSPPTTRHPKQPMSSTTPPATIPTPPKTILALESMLPMATALSPRKTEDVIADLKHSIYSSLPKPSGHFQNSFSTQAPTGYFPNDPQQHSNESNKNGDTMYESDDMDNYDDDDGEDEILQSSKPRKFSEQKRKMNAIADIYIQEMTQKDLKEDLRLNKKKVEEQSARYMVTQAESQRIISSPRGYQTELFERAKEQNTIAVLETGSGKTLIAVLLLRHIFAQELEDRAAGRPKRISFFLVDSVTLVFQQHAVLKANLDQPMDVFCGDMGTDLWNREIWEKHFDKNMVVVCTAEILRQCLHHSFISMNRINLLIFDEAHHAKLDHPYSRIIKDFYVHQDKGTILPRIFGMTASPVDARVDVQKAAKNLETLLHCHIATAIDTSLEAVGATKKEVVAKYATLGPRFETPLYREMLERFRTNSVFHKPLVFAKEATRELGSWCADQVWSFCLSEEEVKKLQAKTESRYHANKLPEPLEVLEQRRIKLSEAQMIVKSHKFSPPQFGMSSKTPSNLSSKVVELVWILKGRFERLTDDKCIVFVKQRYTARLLAHLFSQSNIGTPYLRVGTLVGTRSGDAGDLNTSFREQVITMMNFRKGIVNCLFATSVAEEGLDIPDCNLVIRFDLYTTLIQYIQSRGRARHANSRYIHMYEEGNQEHSQIMVEVHRNENILKEFCKALPSDRRIDDQEVDLEKLLAKEKSHRVYMVPETGAKLTYKMSLQVLANFVDSLPKGRYSLHKPEFVVSIQNKQFVCEVILPESSPIRGAVGRPNSTKQVAKCSAAFETCLLLRKSKYLDENLLPIFTKQLPAMRNALLAVDSKKREAYDMHTKPKAWSTGGVPEELFMTVLSLNNPESLGRTSQPLAVLTRSLFQQLPSFVLHFGAGRNSPVQCTSISLSLQMNSSALQQLNTFTLCIFADVFSKKYEPDETKMPYFLAPIKIHVDFDSSFNPSDLIAWDALQAVEDYQKAWGSQPWEAMTWKDQPDEFFRDKYVVDPWDGSRKFWTVGVAPQYRPLDLVPENTAPRKGSKKNNSNIMEYSSSLWAKAREKRTFDCNQRVFEANYISLRRNLLDDFDTPEEETPKKCFIILEPLKVSPLPANVVAMAYLLPAIIHRIESYLIALDATRLLHLNIRPDLALEAITKDSDNSDDNDSEKINFQRGMGNNYERLEFLGDCFLKMATSISLYSIYPDKDEYSFHVERMMLICNKNLCDNAIKLNLYKFIRSQSFNRRAWYPENLVMVRGKTSRAPKFQKLSEKSIADVCEAIIGAALLSCRDSDDMDGAVRAVTELVSSENHRATAWSDYYHLYEKPIYQTKDSTAAQRDLAQQVEGEHAYHFRYPRLLRSAFVHPSYPFSYEHIPNYQRLEFLGDALLDMACVNFLYHNFPAYDPQWLTEHKMAMVSNQFLGALCVRLGFHKHLLLFNASFQKQVTDYVTDITEARIQAKEDAVLAGKTKEEYSPDYWVSVRHPPKCLPDIVEAYVGAIFVDSEYEYKEVERFFNEHIKWYFTDMKIYDTFASRHPTTFLADFLQINMGCMAWSVIGRNIPNIDGSKRQVMAVVMIHDQVVADYKAESSRYAKVGAAKRALEILKGLPLPEFRASFCCCCRANEEGIDNAGELESSHGTAI